MPATAAKELSVTDAVAKFFFFVSLDEQLTFAAGLKVLNELKAGNHLDPEYRNHWVRTLHRWKPRLLKIRPKAWSEVKSKGFQLPPEFEIGPWVSFMSSAVNEEAEAVLFSRLLGFSDEEIAGGLGVTIGTVRYRVGRGLRHLGAYIEP